RRRGDGERAAHAVHAAVEAELAEHAPAGEVRQVEVAEGGEEPEGDRQVERRALLAHAGGAQVDGHPALGVLEAAVAERRPDALGALADRPVGEADGGGVRQARRDVDLDVDDERVDAAARLYHGGPNLAMHGPRTMAYGKAIAWRYRQMTSASVRPAV